MAEFGRQLADLVMMPQSPEPAPTAPALPPGTPEMKPYDPTMRERMSGALQTGMEKLGMDRIKARRVAQSLAGGQSSALPLQMGLADFVPGLGTALQTQEAVRGGESAIQSAKEGDYIGAAVEAGFAGLGLIPGAAATKKAIQQSRKIPDRTIPVPLREPEGVTYATSQEGPFYRVRPNVTEAAPRQGRGTKESVGPAPTVGGPAGSNVSQPITDEAVQQVIQQPDNFVRRIADEYSLTNTGSPYELPEIPPSSLLKQAPIGRVFGLAATDDPAYKRVVFDSYARQYPQLLEQSGAQNYDQLLEAAYRQLAKETEQQFRKLPINMSYHRAGEGNYENSKELLRDIYGNRHMYVFQGGDPHDFLNKVDPATGLNTNEMFRAVHDFFGHAIHGNQFGPKGEEIAWAAHSKMFSPLARLAMTAETRGQNSFVNYTPINAELKAEINRLNGEAWEASRRGDNKMLAEINKDLKEAWSSFQFAPQKSVILPPEFLDLNYAGGMPRAIQPLVRPQAGTTTGAQLTHFSQQPGLTMTDPAMYGTGIKGEELARLQGEPGAVMERSYFYAGDPSTIRPEPGLGPYRYGAQSSELYDIAADPLQLGTLARESQRIPYTSPYNKGLLAGDPATDIERLVKEYGYEGLINPNLSQPTAIMFKPKEVRPFAKGGGVKDLVKEKLKEALGTATKSEVPEQKMLQGFYRGYAGDYDASKAAAQDAGVYVSPQRRVGEFYSEKRAAQTGQDPHVEMILADPFSGREYGHATSGTGRNPPIMTRARELAPEDVKGRTQLKKGGGRIKTRSAEQTEEQGRPMPTEQELYEMILDDIFPERYPGQTAPLPSDITPDDNRAIQDRRLKQGAIDAVNWTLRNLPQPVSPVLQSIRNILDARKRRHGGFHPDVQQAAGLIEVPEELISIGDSGNQGLRVPKFKSGGKVTFTDNIDAMRLQLARGGSLKEAAKQTIKNLTKKDIQSVASELERSTGSLPQITEKYPQIRDASVAAIEEIGQGSPVTAYRGLSMFEGSPIKPETTPSMSIDPAVPLKILSDTPIIIKGDRFLSPEAVMRTYEGIDPSSTKVYVPSMIDQIIERQPAALEMPYRYRSGEKGTVKDVFDAVKSEKELIADVSKLAPKDKFFKSEDGFSQLTYLNVARNVLSGKWQGADDFLKYQHFTDKPAAVSHLNSFAESIKKQYGKAAGGYVSPDPIGNDLKSILGLKVGGDAAKAKVKEKLKEAFTPKQVEKTAEKMADKIKKDNPKLTDEQVMAKATKEAEQKLKWEKVEKPELEKKFGPLQKAPYSAPLSARQKNVPEVVEKRVEETKRFLEQPTEPWTPPPKELQAFDRALIKDAMEGFPGVEQTRFPRYVPPRSDLSYIEEIYGDPVNRALIEGQIKRGLPLGGETFYASLYPLKVAALERGIPEEKFNQFIYSIAPASARNSIFNEMAVGQFLRDMHARGLPLDEATVNLERAKFKEKFGVGLPLMPVHREGVASVLQGPQNLREMLIADIPTNYKIPTYGTQKAGDFGQSMVLDVHEAAGQTRGSPYHPYFTEQGGFGSTEYGAAESQMLDIAQGLGLPGGTAQAGRWFGGGELTGLKSPRGDALDLLERQTAYTLYNQGIAPTPRNIRNSLLDMIETGEGLFMPWYKKEGMPDLRTVKKKGGAVKKRKVKITDSKDAQMLALLKKG